MKKPLIKQLWSFDHSKALFQLPPFWIAVGLPIFISALMIIVAVANGHLELDFSIHGYQFFLTNLSLPIGIAGLAIPLGIMVASQHRSLQTASQIDAQSSQNKFMNYYKHKDEFFEFMNNQAALSEKTSYPLLNRLDLRKVHKTIFSDLKMGIMEPSLQFASWLEATLEIILTELGYVAHIEGKNAYLIDKNYEKLKTNCDLLKAGLVPTRDNRELSTKASFTMTSDLISNMQKEFLILSNLMDLIYEFSDYEEKSSQISFTSLLKELDKFTLLQKDNALIMSVVENAKQINRSIDQNGEIVLHNTISSSGHSIAESLLKRYLDSRSSYKAFDTDQKLVVDTLLEFDLKDVIRKIFKLQYEKNKNSLRRGILYEEDF